MEKEDVEGYIKKLEDLEKTIGSENDDDEIDLKNSTLSLHTFFNEYVSLTVSYKRLPRSSIILGFSTKRFICFAQSL